MVAFQPAIIYAIVGGSIFVILVARAIVVRSARLIRSSSVQTWLARHLQASVFQRLGWTTSLTRLDVLSQLLYWAGTAIYDLAGTSSTLDVSQRAGSATTFSLVSLMLGDRLDMIGSLLTLSRRTYRTIHATLGVTTVVQMALHVILRAISHQFGIESQNDRYALAVGHHGSQSKRPC